MGLLGKKRKPGANAEADLRVGKRGKVSKTGAAGRGKVAADAEKPASGKRPRFDVPELPEGASEHLKKKQKTMVRKMATQKHYGTITEIKKLWEKVRQKELADKERQPLMSELVELVRGKVSEIVFKHDASRVIQTVLKYGTREHRTFVFEELKPSLDDLIVSHYGRFLVSKMLKYSTAAQRAQLFQAAYGKVNKLLRHREASTIIEEMFATYGNGMQRAALVSELYGPKYALFKPSAEEGKVTLAKIAKESPEDFEGVQRAMLANIQAVLNKRVVEPTILHYAIRELFSVADAATCVELAGMLNDVVPFILHHRDGALVAASAVAYGSTKDRKLICRSLKDLYVKAACEEYGHIVLLRILTSVDDTVMLKKLVIAELAGKLKDVIMDKYAVRCIQVLLATPSTRFLHPVILEALAPVQVPAGRDDAGNVIMVPSSKKDAEMRRKELLAPLQQPLLALVTEDMRAILCSYTGADLALAMLACEQFQAERAAVLDSVVACIEQEDNSLDDDDDAVSHVMQDPVGHRTLGRLIKQDPDAARHLAPAILSHAAHWCDTRGVYVVLALLKQDASKAAAVKAIKPLRKSLAGKSAPGIKAVLEQLKS